MKASVCKSSLIVAQVVLTLTSSYLWRQYQERCEGAQSCTTGLCLSKYYEFGYFIISEPVLNLHVFASQHHGHPFPVAVLASPDPGHHLAAGVGGCDPVLPQHTAQPHPVPRRPQLSISGHQGEGWQVFFFCFFFKLIQMHPDSGVRSFHSFTPRIISYHPRPDRNY